MGGGVSSPVHSKKEKNRKKSSTLKQNNMVLRKNCLPQATNHSRERTFFRRSLRKTIPQWTTKGVRGRTFFRGHTRRKVLPREGLIVCWRKLFRRIPWKKFFREVLRKKLLPWVKVASSFKRGTRFFRWIPRKNLFRWSPRKNFL